MSLTAEPQRPTGDPLAIRTAPGAEAPDVVGSLQVLTSILFDEASQADLLEHVLCLSAQAIDTCSAVSVTVVDDDGGYATAAASHELASQVDALQYELYEGPASTACAAARSITSSISNRMRDGRRSGSARCTWACGAW